MSKLNLAVVSKLIGQQVDISDSQQNKATLKVASVKSAPLHGDEWEAFSIAFQGDVSFRIPQGMYTVSHDMMGEQELFLTAHGPIEYEAVISRKL